MFASCAQVTEVFDHSTKIRPYIFAMDKFNGFVLTEVT